ncbi:MAG TPA: HNH endonuclease, partial [Corynebacterium stationis]|nr:HNH endonuclease [Corynebacterium stationis]
MNGQQIIKLFYTSGVTILRDVYQCSPHDLAGDLMSLNTARKYTRLADVLF